MKAHVNVFLAIVIVAAGMFGGAAAPQAAAQQQGQYGCTVAATADGGFVLQCGLGVEGATYVCAPTGDGNAFAVACMVAPAATATPAPTPTAAPPTPVPPTATPVPPPTAAPTATPGMDMADMLWHAPGAHGTRPAHEHGDAPPSWVYAAGYNPMFVHDGGTMGENVADYKHTGFKGWAGKFTDGQEWYGIFHLDVNPAGQNNRFHSYQLWIKDATGAVSYFHGWLDFGVNANTGPQKVVVCATDSGTRPIIMVNRAGCAARFENWYARAGATQYGGPDVGFNISPNYFDGDPAAPETWQSINGAANNLTRRIEFAWYANRSALRGEIWTDQFGRVMSGPTDARCGTQVTVGERSYTVVCIKQVVQPTLKTIQYPGNSVQRTFPGAGTVVLPN
jgi:hypothetical protein